jgi:bifunctional non-homologous end joining protein LigD
MMAQSSAQPFDDAEWSLEMKWDGYRALATIDSGHVNLWPRTGLRLDLKYPIIVQELEDLKLKSAILDGEIVALDAEGIRSARATANSRSSVAGRYPKGAATRATRRGE